MDLQGETNSAWFLKDGHCHQERILYLRLHFLARLSQAHFSSL